MHDLYRAKRSATLLGGQANRRVGGAIAGVAATPFDDLEVTAIFTAVIALIAA